MIQIRKNTFETNSSSTHSITISTASEFRDLKAGKLYVADTEVWDLADARNWLDEYSHEKIAEFDEYLRIEDYDSINDMLEEECIISYAEWKRRIKNQGLEVYEKHFITPRGDDMVAWGRYGYSG